MDKEKLIKGGIWLSGFSLSIIFSALSLFIGFNNQRHGDYTVLIIGILLLIPVFYCAHKGFKLILDSIFKK
jgi:lipopolysaccharide export LptBFGC system permease protein LptF